MRYFITFSCYGNDSHGDESGSVDQRHNLPGSRLLEACPQRASVERLPMDQGPYFLDRTCRRTVLAALGQVCSHRVWTLLAAHVRTTHVQVIVEADIRPERIMGDFKSYASRSLNGLRSNQSDRKRWARHGSTRWLWTDEDVQEAIRYVIEGQGEPMAVFQAELP